jgi:hypothetical protein
MNNRVIYYMCRLYAFYKMGLISIDDALFKLEKIFQYNKHLMRKVLKFKIHHQKIMSNDAQNYNYDDDINEYLDINYANLNIENSFKIRDSSENIIVVNMPEILQSSDKS